MKKLMVFGISLFLVLLISCVSGVRINEVELNPEGEDSGNEWIELYSESEVNLSDYTLSNHDRDLTFNITFQGYYIVNLSVRWLNNEDEIITLKDSSEDVIDEFALNDTYNDDRTWQYCDRTWSFTDSTKNDENSCETEGEEEAEIYLKLNYDDEIENTEDFEVEVKAYNLKDEDYDVKVYLTSKDGTTISEIYDEDEDEWKSGTSYISKIITGPGNESETFNLRLDKDNEDFIGEAEIKSKIREYGGEVIAEIDKDFDIIEKENEEGESEQNTNNVNSQKSAKETETNTFENNVIKLGKSKQMRDEGKGEEKQDTDAEKQDKVVYESGMEKIKKYAPYVFNFILIIIIILLLAKENLYKRLKQNKSIKIFKKKFKRWKKKK